MAIYTEHLSRCDIDVLEQVVENLIAGKLVLPTIAEIRDAYRAEMQRSQASQDGLPLARTPMPPEVKKQMEELFGKVEQRSAEMEPG